MSTDKIEIILTCIAASVVLILLVIISVDIADFYSDKKTYAMVYQLNTNEANWEWGYLGRWLYTGVLILAGLTVMPLRFVKNKNGVVKKLNWTFLVLFFGFMILRFFIWMKTGYDH